jgi:hypothetical protein
MRAYDPEEHVVTVSITLVGDQDHSHIWSAPSAGFEPATYRLGVATGGSQRSLTLVFCLLMPRVHRQPSAAFDCSAGDSAGDSDASPAVRNAARSAPPPAKRAEALWFLGTRLDLGADLGEPGLGQQPLDLLGCDQVVAGLGERPPHPGWHVPGAEGFQTQPR